MEESVLLGTKPFVDSIRYFIRDPIEWRIFRMSPLWVLYRSMTSRFPPFAFVELVSPYHKKNHYTLVRRYEFYVLVARTISHEWAEYCSCHSNIKFISSRHRVISSIYFAYESRGTLKSFTLFIIVKAVAKLNLGHRNKFEIKFYKISRCSSRSSDNAELVISLCCFVEDGKEMYKKL